jgi:putative lipoic acid-binding regulatory protein
MDKTPEIYKKLKLSLDETMTFPSKYLYKFIIPKDTTKLKAIENIFNYGGAVITTKPSKTGKYTSISILIEMNSSEDIISKYVEIGKVKGVISL